MRTTALSAIGLLASSLVAAQQSEMPTGRVLEGSRQAAMCVGCHNIEGYRASFPEVVRVPKIAGQSTSYIVAALEAYRTGHRRHPTMRGIAGSLTPQAMADLGAYYESLGR